MAWTSNVLSKFESPCHTRDPTLSSLTLSTADSIMAPIADISQALGDFMLKGYVHMEVSCISVLLTLRTGLNKPDMSFSRMCHPNFEDTKRGELTGLILCKM
jgi:hypothetical protein